MRRVIIGITAALAAFFVSPAQAQVPCAPANEAFAELSRDYGEHPVGRGVTTDGKAMVIVTVNAETGTWTMVVVDLRGMACVPAAGQGWEDIPLGREGSF